MCVCGGVACGMWQGSCGDIGVVIVIVLIRLGVNISISSRLCLRSSRNSRNAARNCYCYAEKVVMPHDTPVSLLSTLECPGQVQLEIVAQIVADLLCGKIPPRQPKVGKPTN